MLYSQVGFQPLFLYVSFTDVHYYIHICMKLPLVSLFMVAVSVRSCIFSNLQLIDCVCSCNSTILVKYKALKIKFTLMDLHNTESYILNQALGSTIRDMEAEWRLSHN